MKGFMQLTDEIILPSGESLTSEEILTGFVLLARDSFPGPILGPSDLRHAVVLLMLEALDFAELRGLE